MEKNKPNKLFWSGIGIGITGSVLGSLWVKYYTDWGLDFFNIHKAILGIVSTVFFVAVMIFILNKTREET